jgi:hypothetical protein
MAGSKGLFVRQNGAVGTTPLEGRRAIGGMFVRNSATAPRSGLLNPPDVVVSATPGWSYSLAPINPAINRTADEGLYVFSFEGTTTVATDPSPGADSRWDLIYVKHNDMEKGDADNLPVLGVVKGTPSSSPSKPTGSLPGGALVLAEARIYAGSTSTQDALNTLTQVFPYTALSGAPLKVRDKADRDTITTPKLGQRVIRLDRDNFVQTYTGVGTSGWEYKDAPKRTYYAVNGTNFTNTTGTTSRVVATAVTATKPYARRMTLGGQGTMINAALSGGARKTVYLALSFLVSQIADVQARTAFAWGDPGAYLISTALRPARDVLIGANVNPLGRVWVEDVSGTGSSTLSIDPSFNEYWFEEIPEAD